MANLTTCQTGAFATNPACIPIMTTYCSTDTPAGPTYEQKWQGDEITSPCRKYVSLNPGIQSQYVPVVDSYSRKYLITEAHPITYAQQGSLIYNPAIEDVIEVCSLYPGGCDNVLNQVCSAYSRQDLKSNPNLAHLCGCFMTNAEYDNYAGAFGVTKICDPACVLQSAVKPKDPANQFTTLKCDQTVCVIDDVNISILGQSTTGDISFAQSCGNCSNGGCTCNISDISIQAVESTIKDLSLEQQCGGNARCFKSDANGTPQLVDCSVLGGTSSGTATSPTSIFSNNTVLYVIIGIIILVLIIIIIAFVIRANRVDPLPPRTMYAPSPPSYQTPDYSYGRSLSRAPLI